MALAGHRGNKGTSKDISERVSEGEGEDGGGGAARSGLRTHAPVRLISFSRGGSLM